jgi:hypothetical protein
MRDTFATYQFAKTWLRNKQLVVVNISDRCTGNHCFYVSAQEGCDFAAWDTAARERVTFANETVQSLRERDRRICRPGIRGQENARVRRNRIFFEVRSKGSVDG